jgi:hypothetical protein
LLILLSCIPTTHVFAVDLPKVPVVPEWRLCTADTDCAVVSEACRSCGEVVVLNKEFVESYIDKDFEERRMLGFVRACEACDVSKIRPKCERGICSPGQAG